MTPDPCKVHKRMTVPAVVCIRNYSKKLASIAESTTAHPMRCQLMPTLCPSLCLFVCVLQANVLIRGVVVPDVIWVVSNC